MDRSFMRFLEDLKPPMGAYLHASRRELNQNPARTKAKISSDVLGPKNSLRSYLTASNLKKKKHFLRFNLSVS